MTLAPLPALLLVLSVAAPSGAAPPTNSVATDESIMMRWSAQNIVPPPDMLAWHQRNAPKLATVEQAWGSLLRRMGGHRPARFDPQCLALTTSLEQLDETALLPVPDPLVDLYVKRLLEHLHEAARACRAQQLFNVIYRLEEARTALSEIRGLLVRYSVAAMPVRD